MTQESQLVQRLRTHFVFLGFGLSGAAALIYEVVWTRSLSTIMGSSTYAVSTMLAAFMGGLSVGAALGAYLSPRIRKLHAAFAWCEFGIGLTGLLTIPLILAATPLYIKTFYAFHLSFESFSVVQFFILFSIMAVPTTLMGLTFPLVMKIYAGGGEDVGTQAGRLYCVNTLGAIAGSVAAGFFLVPTLGIKGSAAVAAGINIVVALAILLLARNLKQAAAAVACMLALGPVALAADAGVPLFSYYNAFRFGSYEMATRLVQSTRGKDAPRVLYRYEGIDGNVSLVKFPIVGHEAREDAVVESLINDGKWEAGDDNGFALLAYLPYFSSANPRPRNVLSIGLGSGRTLTHLSTLPIGRVDSVEISEGILDVNRRILSPWLFTDPRIHHLHADGRNYLLLGQHPYDLIVASPSWAVEPASAGMLTEDFFSLARDRLSADGTFAIWVDFFLMPHADLEVVFRTFSKVFGHAEAWYLDGDYIVLVGSKAPFGRPLEGVMAAVDGRRPELRGLYYPAMSEESFRALPAGPVNTDDKPILEFANARNLITWRSEG